MRGAVAIGMLVAATTAAAAGPLPKAPPASTEPKLPAGVTLDPVSVPAGPGFKPRAAKWWKKKKPCPPGAKLEKVVNEPKRIAAEKWAKAFVCRDADGKDHGPGVAVFDNNKPYEDSWSEHGKNHGTRYTWSRDGKMVHVQTFVDDLQHGPEAEWSGGVMIRSGQYKDDKQYGLWTYEYPTGLVLRGYSLDGGDAVGTWIGTRPGVATAIIVEEHSTGPGGTYRVFDTAGQLTFERRIDATGGVATAYLEGVRIADYDCGLDGAIGESRFYDDEGLLQRRWNDRTQTLTDRAGATLATTEDQAKQLRGVRDACTGSLWILEGSPPSRHSAFGKPPPPR